MKRILFAVPIIASLAVVGSARAVDPPTASVPLSGVQLNQDCLRVHFIEVGPGLAMLIETPGDRKHLFVDGGDRGLDGLSKYVEKFVGTKPIDAAIVTHADQDHYLGLLFRIVGNYDVREFWYTGYISSRLASPTSRWRRLLNKVREDLGTTVYSPIGAWVNAGEFESIDDRGTPEEEDDIFLQYLNVDSQPPSRGPIFGRTFNEGQQRNNASLVFKLIYKDVSFLITGDINGRDKQHRGPDYDTEIDSEELELWVRHQLDNVDHGLKATVLQAPHHGSNGSNSLHFLKAVKPEWIVISAGHNKNDHPDEDSIRRMGLVGVPEDHILRTDHGDSVPEVAGESEPTDDDSYVFQTDGETIKRSGLPTSLS